MLLISKKIDHLQISDSSANTVTISMISRISNNLTISNRSLGSCVCFIILFVSCLHCVLRLDKKMANLHFFSELKGITLFILGILLWSDSPIHLVFIEKLLFFFSFICFQICSKVSWDFYILVIEHIRNTLDI